MVRVFASWSASNLPHLTLIELQRKLIGDSVRNKAFAAALKHTVKPAHTVIDLGSGTGFLGFLASKLGAKHVTLIESGDILDVSKKLAVRNKINNLTFIKKHSTDVRGIPKADILMSETLGNFALEENIIESMEDAKRFLKPGGIIIPGKITQCVSPVSSDRLKKDIDVWHDVGFDIAFDEARDISLANMYVKTIRPDDLLSGGTQQWDLIDFSKKNTSIRTKTLTWKGQASIHGFALWWDAELVPGVHLSTAPDKPATHWEQIYLPLLSSIDLKKDERMELTITSDSRYDVKINLTWNVKIFSASGSVMSDQTLDMSRGYLN